MSEYSPEQQPALPWDEQAELPSKDRAFISWMLSMARNIAKQRAEGAVGEDIIQAAEDNLKQLAGRYISDVTTGLEADKKFQVATYALDIAQGDYQEGSEGDASIAEEPEGSLADPEEETEDSTEPFGIFTIEMSIDDAKKRAIRFLDEHRRDETFADQYVVLIKDMNGLVNYHKGKGTHGWSEPARALVNLQRPVDMHYEKLLKKGAGKKARRQTPPQPTSEPTQPREPEAGPAGGESENEPDSDNSEPREPSVDKDERESSPRRPLGRAMGRVANSPIWSNTKRAARSIWDWLNQPQENPSTSTEVQRELSKNEVELKSLLKKVEDTNFTSTMEIDEMDTRARELLSKIARENWTDGASSVTDDEVDRVIIAAKQRLEHNNS